MVGERYQLIATDNLTKERYVIALHNDNKENKGSLGVIDRGVSLFKNELELACYLYKKNKIPTLNVNFKIMYKQKGEKYLPLIFNDLHIKNISRKVDNKINYDDDFVYYVVRKLLAKLNDADFYRYLRKTNRRNQRSKDNGNYVNNKVLDDIIDYYNNYIVTRNIDANSAVIQYSLLSEFTQYKQLRTLYYLMKSYDLEKKVIEQPLETISFDELIVSCNEEFSIKENLYGTVQRMYNYGGMDEVYSVYDLDDIIDRGGLVLKK